MTSDTLTRAGISAAAPHWRLLESRLHAVFRTGTFAAGVRFIDEVARLADAADHHPDVDLRYTTVHVSLISHDVGRVTERDISLAERITELAADQGIEIDPAAPQVLEIAVDALDIDDIRPFWQAVLGYQEQEDPTSLFDPRGLGPAVWFQQMDRPRQQRNRIHLDVWVAHDEVDARVAAALAAGGRIRDDSRAPAFRILADPEGNEACLCTWQGRD